MKRATNKHKVNPLEVLLVAVKDAMDKIGWTLMLDAGLEIHTNRKKKQLTLNYRWKHHDT